MSVIINLPKAIECTTLRVSPKVNYGLLVVMLGSYRFITRSKGTIWWGC